MKFSKVVTADGTILEAGEGSSFRLRYSKDNESQMKNTLFTFAEEDGTAIFFGIARCNLDEDRFSRKRGRAIAASRLQQALKAFNITEHRSKVSGNMLWGLWPKDEVRDLITYFKNIDKKINEERQALYRMRRDSHRERKVREKEK